MANNYNYTLRDFKKLGPYPLWSAIKALLTLIEEHNQFSQQQLLTALLAADDLQPFEQLYHGFRGINWISNYMKQLEIQGDVLFGAWHIQDVTQIHAVDKLLSVIEKILNLDLLPSDMQIQLEQEVRPLRVDISIGQQQSEYIAYISELAEKNAPDAAKKENLPAVSGVKGTLFSANSENLLSNLHDEQFSVDYTTSIDCDL